jgi:hypothetical protein
MGCSFWLSWSFVEYVRWEIYCLGIKVGRRFSPVEGRGIVSSTFTTYAGKTWAHILQYMSKQPGMVLTQRFGVFGCRNSSLWYDLFTKVFVIDKSFLIKYNWKLGMCISYYCIYESTINNLTSNKRKMDEGVVVHLVWNEISNKKYATDFNRPEL